MDIEQIYRQANALLEGHFLLSSGKHSLFYLQSAKVLENPNTAEQLAKALAHLIKQAYVQVDCVCAPALGGLIIGYELARALGVRFIFTERVGGEMTLRRGFGVASEEKVLVCEDIITTGGSAMESAAILASQGAQVVAYAALANRGFCHRYGTNGIQSNECKLDASLPFFALEDFIFETYSPSQCPLCAQGHKAQKPGSRGNEIHA